MTGKSTRAAEQVFVKVEPFQKPALEIARCAGFRL
jgi:hypothetical protein